MRLDLLIFDYGLWELFRGAILLAFQRNSEKIVSMRRRNDRSKNFLMRSQNYVKKKVCKLFGTEFSHIPSSPKLDTMVSY